MVLIELFSGMEGHENNLTDARLVFAEQVSADRSGSE
jgi:hypothetical protein